MTCPSPGDLQHWLGGELDDLDEDVIANHVLSCTVCGGRLAQMKLDDPVIRALRADSPLADRQEAVVPGLIEQMKVLLPSRMALSVESGPAWEEFRSRFATGDGDACQVGSHRIVRLLGVGGMGLVVEAEDPQLRRRVALKVMKPALASSTEARQRFLREAQAVAALDHPHIVRIHHVAEDRGIPYFVMELLQGESLADRLQRGSRLTLHEATSVARQAAEGLAAAHARGLIHRDIKPGNLFLMNEPPASAEVDLSILASDGSVPRIKILDFGLVHSLQDEQRLTNAGEILGTPAYMSPEQARGEHLDPRADLFSLGCVLYEMCTGFTPFQALHSSALHLPSTTEWPRPPTELNPGIPASLSQLIVQLLAKDPQQRPSSASEVADVLCSLERGSELTSAPRPAEIHHGRISKFSRRALTAGVVLIIALASGVWFFQGYFFKEALLSGSWSKGPPLAQARSGAMAMAIDGRLYLAGGVIPEWHLDTLEVFDPDPGVWKTLAPMPKTDTGDNGRSAASVGVIDGKLYLAGGWRHRPPLPTKTLLIYDPQSNTWENGPPMPTLSGDSVGGVIDRKFYVLIGTNGNDGLRHLFYVYDPDLKSWKELKPAPRPHSQGGAGVIGDKLYVIGGDTAQGATGGLDVYDPTTEAWTTLAPMPTPRIGPAAAVMDGRLIVMGGHDGKIPLATVEAYDPRTDRWTRRPDLLDARSGASAVGLGSNLYLLGGHVPGASLASFDVFTLSSISR